MIDTKIVRSFIFDLCENPVFNDSNGQIINEETNDIYITANSLWTSWRPYYWFEFRFDMYKYGKINKKIYQLEITIDLKSIVGVASSIRQTIISNISHVVKQILANDIKVSRKKSFYQLSTTKIRSFIQNVEDNNVKIQPYQFYKLSSTMYIDFINRVLVPTSKTHEKQFSKKGGIIETNNVGQLIATNFINKNHENILVICPENITNYISNLWSSGSKQTVYVSPIALIQTVKLPQIYWNKVIISEFYPSEHLTCIKKFLESINYDILWIINNFPLSHYFNKRPSLKNMYLLLSLWLPHKNTNRRDIVKHLLINFSMHYRIVKYSINNVISEQILLNSTEREIYHLLCVYYNKWKSILCTSYSHRSIETINKHLCNPLLVYISSICMIPNLNEYIKKKIYRILDQAYTQVHANDQLDLSKLTDFYKKYYSFTLTNHQTAHIDTCAICYDPYMSRLWVHLVCGHNMCLECFMNCLSKRTECPVCRNETHCDMIAIIDDKESEIQKFLAKLSDTTIVLTTYNGLTYFSSQPNIIAKIYDITKSGILHDILGIPFIEKVVIFRVASIDTPHGELLDRVARYLSMRCIDIQYVELSISRKL